MRPVSAVGLALLALLEGGDAFVSPAGSALPSRTSAMRPNSLMSLRMNSDAPLTSAPQTSRRAALSLFGAGLAVAAAAPAHADMTLTSIKRAYFRYVPRIESGRDLFVLKLRDALEKEDWAATEAIFTKVSAAQEDSTKAALGLDIKVSAIETELLVPMQVWTTSFAEKGTSPKQRKMDAKLAALRESLEGVRAAAAEGDKAKAIEAWNAGRASLNSYIKTANKGLTLQVAKLDTIPEDWKTYEKSKERPQSSFTDSGGWIQ